MSIHSSNQSLRLIKGFSQEYMADKLKISQNAFGRLELGHSGISVKRTSCDCRNFGNES